MAIQVRIIPSHDLSLRDPQETDLGRRILASSIELLDELGLEAFTFKKLAARLKSAEASIYRYFSSKHQLLLYLVSWYWDWVHHLVNQSILASDNPKDRLRAAIKALTQPYVVNPNVPYINEELLHRIVISEGSKAYHTKAVDQENSKGIFLGYKSLSDEIAQLILEIRPGFPYPRTLATSLFEMAHNHPYFAVHLPKLTELPAGGKMNVALEDMLWYWVEGLVIR